MTTTLPTTEDRGVDLLARTPRRRFSIARFIGVLLLVAMAAFALYSLRALDVTWASLTSSLGNIPAFFAKIGGADDPWAWPSPGDLIFLIAVTVGIVLIGTLIAAVLSVPVAWIAAANTTPWTPLRYLGRAISVCTRAIPDVVIALVVSFAFVAHSAVPGIIAIGFHSIGMISKLFADAIEQIDEGPRLAIRAAGGSRAQEFWSGVFPQVLPSWIATVLHRFDINIRGSAILGYAGVAGLGYAMANAFKQFQYGAGLIIAFVIFLLCVILEFVSSTVRRQLLGIQPQGRGMGDRLLRAATRGGPVPPETAGATPHERPTPSSLLRRPWTRSRAVTATWMWGALVVVVLAFLAAHLQEPPHGEFWPIMPWHNLFWQNDVLWKYLRNAVSTFWPPGLGGHEFSDYLGDLTVTIQIAFAAALVGIVFSLLFGSFAARNVAPNSLVRNTFRGLLVFFRGVPELIVGLLLIITAGLGPVAGVVALAWGGIGLLGKLIADSFEEVPRGPETALTAAGATRGQRYFAATLPQGTPSLIGNSLYLVDTNIRSATILGFVGAGGIGFHMTQYAGLVTKFGGQLTTLVLLVFVAVLILEGVATYLRRVFK